MSSSDDPAVPGGSVGTVPHDAPVPREEHERAIRRLAVAVESVRADVIQLAAQVVALTDELTRRIDPALEDAVETATPVVLERIRIADDRSAGRLELADAEDKYATPSAGPDCTAILPICQARCCTLHFALTTQDLDEGVIRWDYGRPYVIKQRVDDGRCVHNHPTGHFCTVYHHRPRPCRQYDCRTDTRIWKDFERRELSDATPFARKEYDQGDGPTTFDLVERVRARQVALAMEHFSLNTNEAARRRHEAAELAALRAARGEPSRD